MPADHVTTELDIARAVASGELPSPTIYGNSKYFRLRVSGTGTSHRSKYKEFVFRPADIWLSPEMVARVPGLPVISEHPPGKETLDGRSFYERIVGICVLGFVEGTELMAVCRVIDDGAATILTSGFYDTSPSAIFADPQENVVLPMSDDDDLLIEGTPSFLDHLALIDTSEGGRAVWNKTGADLGVEISEDEKENANG